MRERLYRSRTDRMLFGVAGGMARFLDVDASIVRIVWALLVVAGGAGLLLYIVAAIVMPEDPVGYMPPSGPTAPPGDPAGPSATGSGGTSAAGSGGPAWSYRAGAGRRDRGGGGVLLGLVLVVLGGWFLVQRLLPQLDAGLIWPVVLLALGGALVIGALRR